MQTIAPEKVATHQKFHELILFLSQRSEGDPAFGTAKLTKLLFFADFLAYRKSGRAITGQRYLKLESGPAPRGLDAALEKMKADGTVAESTRDWFGRPLCRTVALRDANLEGFTAEEIALVTELIEQLWGKDPTEVSGLSYRFLGWQAAQFNEDIPYETALLCSPELSTHIAAKCQELEETKACPIA